MDEDTIDGFLKNNFALTGRQESHEVRRRNFEFEEALTQLSQLYQSGSSVEEELAFVRVQLGRLPVLIAYKESPSLYFAYFYAKELQEHNFKLNRVKLMLQELNESSAK